MQISLELSKVEVGLLRALCPRGNARKDGNYMETTAKNLLLAGMQREAKLRRITETRSV
ncbi:MAG: hypothetical protein JOY96_03535 [Verrucomicrobia bacterium]|nr:hypothetical protein [Verrucomicrobiota bacterium]